MHTCGNCGDIPEGEAPVCTINGYPMEVSSDYSCDRWYPRGNHVIRFLWEKSNDPKENMCCKPTTEKEALDILVGHFIGDQVITTWPYCGDQMRTEEVAYMLTHHESYRFKQLPWYKQLYLRLKCFFTDEPLYKYF